MSQPFDELPLRDDLRGLPPYGAPQLDVAVRLNTNENPYPLPEAVAEAIGKALRGRAARPQPLPGPGRGGAARGPGRTTSGTASPPTQVWAANGSNEVQQQLLQAFGGPGRTAMGFSPSYSMHPLLAAGTGTGLDRRAARRRLRARPPTQARRQVRVHRAGPGLPLLAEQPHRHGARPRRDRGGRSPRRPGMVIVDEAYAEFARAGHAQRAGAAAAVTRGWSSPGR